MLFRSLNWVCEDPDGDPITYDVYFGYSSDNLELVSSGQSENMVSVDVIHGQTFYWKVIAHANGESTDSGVKSFTASTEELTGTMVRIMDSMLDQGEVEAIVVKVKGIGTISGSELKLELDTSRVEFVDWDDLTLAEFLAANPGSTYEDFEPACQYKATTASFLGIVKLQDATGSVLSLSGAYTNTSGRSIADGDFWHVYVKAKDVSGKTLITFAGAEFKDASLNPVVVDATDQGVLIVK